MLSIVSQLSYASRNMLSDSVVVRSNKDMNLFATCHSQVGADKQAAMLKALDVVGGVKVTNEVTIYRMAGEKAKWQLPESTTQKTKTIKGRLYRGHSPGSVAEVEPIRTGRTGAEVGATAAITDTSAQPNRLRSRNEWTKLLATKSDPNAGLAHCHESDKEDSEQHPVVRTIICCANGRRGANTSRGNQSLIIR